MKNHIYYVYILLCADGSYYTGMTNSLERRLEEHKEGVNKLCYTFSRLPFILKYSQTYRFANDAISREKQIKGWSRKKKEALINGNYDELKRLAKKHGEQGLYWFKQCAVIRRGYPLHIILVVFYCVAQPSTCHPSVRLPAKRAGLATTLINKNKYKYTF